MRVVRKPTRLGAAKTSQARIASRERQRRALELRKAGATYDTIAQQLGYSTSAGAHAAVKAAFGAIIQEPVTDLRTMQYERLNHMLLTIWPNIQAGDERSIETGLRIMDKMDRLYGTDSPAPGQGTTNNVLIIDGDETDYITGIKKILGIEGEEHGSRTGSPGRAEVRRPQELLGGDDLAGRPPVVDIPDQALGSLRRTNGSGPAPGAEAHGPAGQRSDGRWAVIPGGDAPADDPDGGS